MWRVGCVELIHETESARSRELAITAVGPIGGNLCSSIFNPHQDPLIKTGDRRGRDVEKVDLRGGGVEWAVWGDGVGYYSPTTHSYSLIVSRKA